MATGHPLVVYTSATCLDADRLLYELERMNVHHVTINIDENRSARGDLRQITGGNLSVPTVLWPDGTIQVEPGLATVYRRLGRNPLEAPLPFSSPSQEVWESVIQDHAQAIAGNTYRYILWVWGYVMVGFIVGLALFAVGTFVGEQFAHPYTAMLSYIFFGGLFVMGMLALIPPFSSVAKWLAEQPYQHLALWALMYLVAVVLGVSVGSTGGLSDLRLAVVPALRLMIFTTASLVAMMYITSPLWGRLYPALAHLQWSSGILITVSFIMIYFISESYQPLLINGLQGLLLANLVMACFSVANGTPNYRAVDAAGALLFPWIALMFVTLMHTALL